MKTWRNKKYGEKVFAKLSKAKIIVIFDTETTGTGKNSKIIQFSAIKCKVDVDLQLKTIDVMDIYINPMEPLDQKIKELTGIDDVILECCQNEGVLGPKILQFLLDSDIWAAYNSSFDLRMLKSMAGRLMFPFFPKDDIDVRATCSSTSL